MGGVLGAKIWWLSPGNASKHWDTLGCTPCGVPACTPATLRNVPESVLNSITEGPHFSCTMVGGGGRGVASYIYPSIIDETAPVADVNFETVGETATLYLVTNECITWSNTSGHETCSPWDDDGIVRRGNVAGTLGYSFNEYFGIVSM